MKQAIIKSTLSNYILLILKILFSLALVRIMFLGISNEEYGFWALLWTIFGYSLLLDFGFGTAIQKATSQSQATKNWDDYNHIVSTIFFSYALLSIIILISTVVIAQNLEEIFVFKNYDIDYYKTVFYIFGIGTSLVFPFGFFREVLRGLQKISIRNNIDIVFLVLNFVLLSGSVYFNLSLIYMASFAIIIQFFTNVVMGYYVYKNVPGLKISLSLFNKQKVKELIGFSFFAYIVMFSNVIIFRTDQLIISIFSTVALVGFYQVVSRISEIFRQLSTQIHDILGPISASLFITNNHDELGNILFTTNRVVGFISTMILIPSILFIDELLFFWLKIDNEMVINTAMVLLLSMYILVFLRSSSVQVLLMCNKHKQLTYVAIIESILNLALSIYLVKNYSILGVAIGTLIPNLFLAIVYNIPVACKFSNVSIFNYSKDVIFKTLFTGVFIFFVMDYLLINIKIDSILELFYYGFISMIFFIIVYFFVALSKIEKKQILSFIISIFKHKITIYKKVL